MVFTREQGICAFHLLDKPLAYYPHVAEKQFNTWPNDILVFPEDVPKAITLIQQAVQNQELDAEVINKKVKRLLRLKYQMALHTWQPIEIQNVETQLHTPQGCLLKQQLF